MELNVITTAEHFAELSKKMLEGIKDVKTHYFRIGSLLPIYTLAMTQMGKGYRLSLCGQLPSEDGVVSFRVNDGIARVFADHILGKEWKEIDTDQQLEEVRNFVSRSLNNV